MDSVSGVGVLDKAVSVLHVLADRGALGLADLQQAVGLPRATAHRLAVALEQHGMVRRTPDGRFELGLALVGLGRAAGERLPVASAARPIIEALRDRTHESVQLFVRDGAGRRCVVSLESTHGLRWIVPVGALLPLSRGSAGRVLSGQKTNAGGWIESTEEREKGVASVSAPVTDAVGNVIAAVSVSGPVERMGAAAVKKHGAMVVKVARSLSV